MHDVIRLWLNSKREYYQGLALAISFYDNKPLLEIMKIFDNERNKARLLEIMQTEFESLKQKTGKNTLKKTLALKPDIQIKCKSTIQNASDFSKSPVYILAKNEADKAYRKTMALRAILFEKTKAENWEDVNIPSRVQERSKAAVEVVLEHRKASQFYETADFVLKNGSLPVVEETNEVEFEALPDHLVQKALSNARKAISKLRNKPPTAARQELIEKHQANIDALQKKWDLLK